MKETSADKWCLLVVKPSFDLSFPWFVWSPKLSSTGVSENTLDSRMAKISVKFWFMLFKWDLVLYIKSALTEGRWRHFQWLSSSSLKSCPVSIIIILYLLLLIAFCAWWRTHPGRVLSNGLWFYHHMFSNSLSLCFPILKTMIKELAKTWDLQLKISESWFDFCLSCPAAKGMI